MVQLSKLDTAKMEQINRKQLQVITIQKVGIFYKLRCKILKKSHIIITSCLSLLILLQFVTIGGHNFLFYNSNGAYGVSMILFLKYSLKTRNIVLHRIVVI